MQTNKIPMTEINHLLSSPEAPMHLKNMFAKLDVDIQRLERELKAGVSNDDYQSKSMELRAYYVAKQVLNSLHMYHQQTCA